MSDIVERLRVEVVWEGDVGGLLEEAAAEIERLREDISEQCRLHGMGSQREARQLAVIEEQRREIERLRHLSWDEIREEGQRVSREEAIKLLESEIAALRKERRWVSVAEGLPPVDERVLVVCGSSVEMMRRHSQEQYWDWDGDIDLWPVTHWQPLPEVG